ncbi:MAG: hypothetical protein ABF976_13530 [Acetobacter syzygii]|uniref:hypothetical protein n=1 Tax=Acetobacter syzygii TaxID=146476 RepID=UPI0039EB283E
MSSDAKKSNLVDNKLSFEGNLQKSESVAAMEEPHYSDMTLAALVKNHGWHYHDAKRPQRGVERLFAGMGPDGVMVPNGERYLGADYSADPESRRYIALHYGLDLLKDWDGREGTPAEIAAQVNEWAEHYALMTRIKLKAA